MRRALKRGGLCVAVLALGAAAVILSGILPVKASSGHWAVTAALLHFTMQRSVATHSLAVSGAPQLDDPRRVLMGAGHYHGGCRPCHGAPGEEMPEIARHMTPPPPWLPDRIGEYDDEELFYIVRHGVKFTGMPAWPAAHRDDEVWAVVAFLRRLPGLDRAGYRQLVHPKGPAAAPELESAPAVVRQRCARCHGLNGQGRGEGAFPRLAGQRPEYLRGSLEAYASGARHSGIMQPIAVALDAAGRDEAVNWYAARNPGGRSEGAAADTAAGAALARDGLPEREIPACSRCHGPGHEPHHPGYPKLAGQPAAYLEQQLELFTRRARGGGPYLDLMREVTAHGLSPEEMGAVARFYAALSPSEQP